VKASEGILLMSIYSLFLVLILCCLPDTLASSSVAALATANARIASLEAELRASQKAYDAAAIAKTNAEKSQKSALGKAKKAEKALADANKDHAQREQAVAERLHTMSTAAESKCFTLSSICDFCCTIVPADSFLLFFSSVCFVSCRIYRGVSVVPATGR
jgi:biopolymer transport protein ExbB/TolQ